MDLGQGNKLSGYPAPSSAYQQHSDNVPFAWKAPQGGLTIKHCPMLGHITKKSGNVGHAHKADVRLVYLQDIITIIALQSIWQVIIALG